MYWKLSLCSRDGFQLLFPLPRRQRNESGKCSVLPHLLRERERPEREGNFGKLSEIPSTKTLCPGKQPLSSAWSFCPFGEPGVCCECWQPCSPVPYCFHIPPVLSFGFFVCLFQEQEGVSHHCQRLHLAQFAFWKYPYAVSSLAGFFSISLNLHLSGGRSELIPALESCCDAPAISHLTAEAGILSLPLL